LQNEITCEAERHAVWESENGDLIDITPREINIDEIMFLSDNNFEYKGQLVDNIRINVTNNIVVDHFIKICEAIEKLYMLGERIDDTRLEIAPEVGKMISEYSELKALALKFIRDGKTLKSKCICGGNKSYKNCHGKVILQKIAEDLRKVE